MTTDTPKKLTEQSDQDILEWLTEEIVEQLGVDAEDVTLLASFKDDLNADSLDLVELIMTIETKIEEFGIADSKITDEDAAKITTVGEALTFIKDVRDTAA